MQTSNKILNAAQQYGPYIGFILLAATKLCTADTISIRNAEATMSFGNSIKGTLTLYPQVNNTMTACTVAGNDPTQDQYFSNFCVKVLSNGSIEALYFALARAAKNLEWYPNSPCEKIKDTASLTYSKLMKCYSWLAEHNKKDGHGQPLSKFVRPPSLGKNEL